LSHSQRVPALLSIHDVAPEHMDSIRAIRAVLMRCQCWPVMLLVIPGRPWTPALLDELRQWSVEEGCELAGHGWHHRCDRIHGFRHRLHSLFISRNVAEHYTLPPEQLLERIHQTKDWFLQQNLPAPDLYVPPAWAAGHLRREQYARFPFTLLELTSGVVHCPGNKKQWLPLVGYEADTRLRSWSLRAWNTLNVAVARRVNRPLRIAIHPHDLTLRLARDLHALLSDSLNPMTYRDVFMRE